MQCPKCKSKEHRAPDTIRYNHDIIRLVVCKNCGAISYTEEAYACECPECSNNLNVVILTNPGKTYRQRVRECRGCFHKWKTTETETTLEAYLEALNSNSSGEIKDINQIDLFNK